VQKWSPRRDSNPRPSDYESDPNPPAGPAQAHPRCSGAGPIPSRPVLCRLVVTPGLPERLPPCWVIRSMATHPEHRASDRDRMLKSDSNWGATRLVVWPSVQRHPTTGDPNSTPRSLGSNILLETPHQKRWAAIQPCGHPVPTRGEWFPLVSSGLGSAVRSRANPQPDQPPTKTSHDRTAPASCPWVGL
jgi:hypothetical protein